MAKLISLLLELVFAFTAQTPEQNTMEMMNKPPVDRLDGMSFTATSQKSISRGGIPIWR